MLLSKLAIIIRDEEEVNKNTAGERLMFAGVVRNVQDGTFK